MDTPGTLLWHSGLYQAAPDPARQKDAPAEPSSRPKPVYNSAGAERTLGNSDDPRQAPGRRFIRALIAREVRLSEISFLPGPC